MTLNNNTNWTDPHNDLLAILAAPQIAYVDLECNNGDEVWIEFVQPTATGFTGRLYNNVCGGSVGDTVIFVKEQIFSATCCARPTGR